MPTRLLTFGGLRAETDGGELDWLLTQHSRAALLVYLAVEQRVSRDALTAVFWPESDAENARHALRQSVYQLRRAIGEEWVESRAHELVVAADVHTDARLFTEAIEQGDLESAVALYRGSFLDGVHLVDLKPWESWVDARRAHYARTFRKACRDLIDARRAVGDRAGEIAMAERWIAVDPLDDEAQHRLIESLAEAGERTEAIRQYDTYVRALEPDGLQPLDETSALANQLRSGASALPKLRRASSAPPALGARPALGALPAAERHDTHPNARARMIVPTVAAVALVAVLTWTLIKQRRQVPSEANGTTVAVLPFNVRGSASVAYLRDGMVSLLSTALDGAGAIRPADTRAVFASVASLGRPVDDTPRAERVAARVAAGMYVLGDIVEAGGQLQIDATIYQRPASAKARATVTGAADSVFSLVDQLAARLLGGLGDPAGDRLLRTASLATSSLPAFKAYVQGEELMRASRFEQAADAYQSAINLDSAFALAHYRLALAREWAPLPGEDEAAAAAARHASRLSPRDRAFLEAFRQWRAGDAIAAERAYQAQLTRYPEDLDAWFQLGEIQFHHGPLVGQPIGESAIAWRKVHRHEPRSEFVVTHLARISVVNGDNAGLDSVLAAFSPNEFRQDRRLVELQLLRAIARSDTAGALSVANDVKHWEPFAVWRAAVWVAAFAPNTGLARRVLQEFLDGYSSPGLRADMLWFASMLDLSAGRVAAAIATLGEAVASERRVASKQQRQGFADITEWFAATLPLPYGDSSLLKIRDRARRAERFEEPLGGYRTELGLGASMQLEPIRQYTIGVLSLRLKDKPAAVRAARTLRQLAASSEASPLTRDLERGLRARIAVEEQRAEVALAILNELESEDTQGDIAAVPFASRASERYLQADILASLGHERDALRWFAALGDGSASEIPLRALSHLRQAEIYDRLHDTREAKKHYARVVDSWSGADAQFRESVDYARRRLAELAR